MAVTKRPRSTAVSEQEQERLADAFISAAEAKPKGQSESSFLPRKAKIPATIKWDSDLLARIDAAASRKGISRTAWMHFKLSEVLDQETGV